MKLLYRTFLLTGSYASLKYLNKVLTLKIFCIYYDKVQYHCTECPMSLAWAAHQVT